LSIFDDPHEKVQYQASQKLLPGSHRYDYCTLMHISLEASPSNRYFLSGCKTFFEI
jgi:hypothetical protein